MALPTPPSLVQVPGTDVALGRLGYGCASLMARTGMAESIRLLEVAYDAGITHFDVARSYGYGEAESAVGRFLTGRRDTVTVTTKVGIAPPQRTRRLAAAKAVARRAAVMSPRLRRALRRRAGAMVESGRFDIPEVRSSFEQSLRELRTDRVDLLLLHECQTDDLTDDLLAWLEGQVAAGAVGAFGVATPRPAAEGVVHQMPAFAPVVQIPDSVVQTSPPAVPGLLITHSGLGSALTRLRSLVDDPARRAQWSARVGADLGDPEVLTGLMLAGAMNRNAAGVVLTSSRDETHLRTNARVAHQPPSGEQVAALQALAADTGDA